MPGAIEVDQHKIRQLRREHALSQRALAELSGVSLDAINQLEGGKRRANPVTVRRLAKALSVAPKELIATEGEDDAR